jgi:hypothetical protein
VRVRGGRRWQTEDWEFGAALEASYGSASSAQVVRVAHDNERGNDLNVDLFYAERRFGEDTAVLLGKAPLPLTLTSMLWDDDLRPVGASVRHGVALREFDRVELVAGYFAGDHIYGDHDSRIAALQAAWHVRPGAPTHGSVVFTYLDFDGLEDVTASGLTRSNRRAAGVLVSDYELANLTMSAGVDLAGKPFLAELDLVHNFGADDLDDGARITFTWGDSRVARDWQFVYSFQRIQRDAVMAAFNSEEWWFHSATRGSLFQASYGISEHWRVLVSGFFERSDPLAFRTERLLVDLRAEF